MIGPSRSVAGAGRDALPRVRLHVSTLLCFCIPALGLSELGLLPFSFACFFICAFFGRAAPDRAGARPYHRACAGSRAPSGATACLAKSSNGARIFGDEGLGSLLFRDGCPS